jgi:hypothetical protein
MLKFPGLNPVDYLVIGHITKDLTPTGYQLGGSVSFAGLTARALGQRVGIVTSWGQQEEMVDFENIAIANHPSEYSTTFENKYPPEGRRQHLHHLASNLAYYHIPESWRQARIIHLAPVAQEVEANMVRHFPDAFVYVTIQGWLRQWDSHGLVSPSEWPEAAYILSQAHAAVVSEEDVQNDQQVINAFAAACPILVVTRGANGASLFTEGNLHHIPAPQVEEVDPTGAGDIFAAAFFTHLTQNGNPIAATEFGVRLASDSVTRTGLEGVPSKEMIQKISTEV